MQLLINTADKDDVLIALLEGEEVLVEKKFPARFRQAELLLLEIDGLLSAEKVNLKKIDKILVENKGESFTALRIGVVTANALAYALGIPVLKKGDSGKTPLNNNRKYRIVEPEYNREPNITKKK